MNFKELKIIIKKFAETEDFQCASNKIQNIVFNLSKSDFIPIINEIGSIPEDIIHDSTEEKLYAKTSDIVLAKCFIELGLKSSVITERANCADVTAKSVHHNYSLVGDAKAYRLSRTAKNQKDFKVESMVHWKCDNDFSVLCCPYFQYPKTKSQIYGQALKGNVSLFSWEYFSLLLENDVKETLELNLAPLWNFSSVIAGTTTIDNMDMSFLRKENEFIKNLLNYSDKEFCLKFNNYKENIIKRCSLEIEYWNNEIVKINKFTKEQAIKMLIKSLKLNEKINSIKKYIDQLEGKDEY